MSKEELASKYTEYLLEEGKVPLNVYKFCKLIGIDEPDFYGHFSSFSAIEKWVMVHFFNNTLGLLNEDEAFQEYGPKEKLLSFYYTYFEVLNANRSLVMQLFDKKNPLDKLQLLKELRSVFTEMVGNLNIETAEIPVDQLRDIQAKGLNEAIWGQFMMILKYWMSDESPSFEKTDLFIEKTTKVGFDLVQSSPLENIMDLGKFLVKDKFRI